MKIFDYEEVKMNWDSFTYPIAVGTPVSIDGVLADNASAHGLIARTVFAKPDADETLKVMTGGIIDMEEIIAGYGKELSSAAVNALCGISFYKDGVCIPSGGGGGGVTPEIMAQIENAQWKSEEMQELFRESVTTVAEGSDPGYGTLAYDEMITADVLKVTFNGVEYTCVGTGDDVVMQYGAPINDETGLYDFSEYPFNLYSGVEGSNSINTETPGTYTVSASALSVSYSSTFTDAVKKNESVVKVGSAEQWQFAVVNFNGATLNLNSSDSSSLTTLTIDANGTTIANSEGPTKLKMSRLPMIFTRIGSTDMVGFTGNGERMTLRPIRNGIVVETISTLMSYSPVSYVVKQSPQYIANYSDVDIKYYKIV